MKPIIAIVGRPNVGKSTLFNRLVKRRKALVEDEPGVTRDRNYAEAFYEERSFILIDTGGFEPAAKERIRQQVREQAEVAIQEADLVLFLLDGQEGLNPVDFEIAHYIRKVAKPVFYVVNKIDGERREENVIDFYRLGVPSLFSISAEHGRGVTDLLEGIFKVLPASSLGEERTEGEIRVALVGRPNVGKSSLLNKLVGRPRAVVNSTPGTTRDAIDTPLWRDGRKYVFIDTAGIRRQSKVSQRLEKYMTIRALRSLERCDVALILLDGYEGLTEQDARIATFAQENGRALIFAVNKWDLVAKDTSTLQEYGQRIRAEIKTLDYVPILFISALTGQRVSRIFTAIEAVIREHRKRIATAELNRWLQETLRTNAPPPAGRRSVKVYYISQVDAAPPTFVLFTNDPARVTETYQRYLMRQLREKFGFAGTPLRILLRRRKKEDG